MMTNENNTTPDHDGPTIEHDVNEMPKKRFSTTFIVGAAIAGAIVVAAGAAVAQGFGGPHGFGHRFIGHKLERLMDKVDASDTQQDRIWAIVDKTRADMRPVGREFRDSREKVAALLSAPTIDKVAVEALRAERIAAIDNASKQAVAALVEAAEVLTPEQRKELVDEFKDGGKGRWQ